MIASWISGLHRENSDALGFIPMPTIDRQYVQHGRYVLQKDAKGRNVGYLLHGVIAPGRSVVLSQACIQHEKRLKGFGEEAVSALVDRSEKSGASSIRLRCAEDTSAVEFWNHLGFNLERWEIPGNKRNRRIAVMSKPLMLPLFQQ